ncbi:MAG: carbohydrate ABC transporter permease, partial [Bacteroidota bacterium]
MKTLGQQRFFNKVWIYLLIIIILFIYLFPLMWQFSTSLKDSSEILTGYYLIPKKMSFESYYIAWSKFNLRRYLFNTMTVALAVLAGTLISCSLAGYAFGQLRFPGKNSLFNFYLATMMVPGAVTLIPTYYIILK